MSDWQLSVPVAFIIFNRPDVTEKVFTEIAKARPPKLLIIGDGPRSTRLGEHDLVSSTRKIVEKVDWECSVLTNFSDTNLGCKNRVSSGLDWVFEQVEEAIILEDDCLPDPTFFRFCEEMLHLYKFDQRVAQITGVNFQFGHRHNDDSYYFSKYAHIWGWATWRDRWQESYEVNMDKWPQFKERHGLKELFNNFTEEKYWGYIFELVHKKNIDTWDYQWFFSCLLNGQLTVVPQVSLITNIGFGANATHTTEQSLLAHIEKGTMEFPPKHPLGIHQNRVLDDRHFDMIFSPSISRRFKEKIYKLKNKLFN